MIDWETIGVMEDGAISFGRKVDAFNLRLFSQLLVVS